MATTLPEMPRPDVIESGRPIALSDNTQEDTDMQAFVVTHPGADTVELAEVPTPRIDDDEILVHIEAIGVGIHDSYFLPPDISYPFPAGIEGAGVVAEVGSSVSAPLPGDRIAFVSSMQPKGGTWAELAVVRADALIVPIPAEMDFVEAAAVPIAGNTALRALDALAMLPAGGSLFIAGGSGAIGTLAIQIARKRGWRVAASASAPNLDYLLSLGAELAVDYRDPTWTDQVLRWAPGGVDAAITVPPDTSADSVRVVHDGGRLITISGDQVAAERDIQMEMVAHQADVRDELAQLLADIAAGELHLELEHVYPFIEAPTALAKVQTGHARGKVVLRLGARG